MLDPCVKAKQKYCYWLIVLCFHCLLPMTLLCGVESAHLNRNALLGRLVRFSRKHDVRVETLVLCVCENLCTLWFRADLDASLHLLQNQHTLKAV